MVGRSLIPYHGTPIGGSHVDICRFLRGRHALVPWFSQQDLGIVADVCQSFVFDNSAYSLWNRKRTVDWKSFHAWVRDWYRHPGFDWALIPDTIDGTEEENNRLEAEWPQDLPGVPVFHMHESLARLDRLCDQYRTVALGSSGVYKTPGSKVWWPRMREMMAVACDVNGRPRAKLHGLRMMSTKIFTKLPFASADSTNAGVNSGAVDRFGYYVPLTRAQRADVIASRIEVENSLAVYRFNDGIDYSDGLDL